MSFTGDPGLPLNVFSLFAPFNWRIRARKNSCHIRSSPLVPVANRFICLCARQVLKNETSNQNYTACQDPCLLHLFFIPYLCSRGRVAICVKVKRKCWEEKHPKLNSFAGFITFSFLISVRAIGFFIKVRPGKTLWDCPDHNRPASSQLQQKQTIRFDFANRYLTDVVCDSPIEHCCGFWQVIARLISGQPHCSL